MRKNLKGFTLIELLIVIGIMVVLAGVVIVALNPAKQFGLARNSQRWSNVNAILNAVGQRMAENRGNWSTTCGTSTVSLPTTLTQIGTPGSSTTVDLGLCIVPSYMASMVWDPSTGNAANTGYYIFQSATTSRITVQVGNQPNGAIDDSGAVDNITATR